MQEIEDSIEVAKLLNEVLMLLRRNFAKSFESCGITVPQGMVIRTIGKYGKMKISELSNKLGLSNSTVSGIVDRLEKQGMVERIRGKEDRRVVYVCLTTKFEKMHQDIHRKADENIRSVMNKGTQEDINKVMDGLNTLKKLLKD